MDFKYIIWNYQAKRLHLTCNKNNLVIPTHEFDASNLQCTGHNQNFLIYITCKLPVQYISVQVQAPNCLKDFLQNPQVNGHSAV